LPRRCWRGETVRGLDSFITGNAKSERIGSDGVRGGRLADPAVCSEACKDVEIVFHEAALASVPRSVADPVPQTEIAWTPR